jgi:serine protease Do
MGGTFASLGMGFMVDPSQVESDLQPLGEPPAPPRIHPLDRPEAMVRSRVAEDDRIRLAWAKLVWLMAFLAVLLAISYFVPYIAETTQYAMTRGKQRAEHDFAKEHLGESPIREVSRASQMVSQMVGPSVVHISTSGPDFGGPHPLTKRMGMRIPTEGQGSGVVMDAAGYILTNNHVIKGASSIQVSLADGRKVKAAVVGRDGATDLAVLKINADGLVPASFGDSESAETGAFVWAVGSPFGLERTITWGILSAKHRAGLAGTPNQDFLQTDAAVNPGNSGGPLVDSSGKVIGINTAIVGDAYQGVSFAIPSNVAQEIYGRIKAGRGWLGVQLEEMTAERAKAAGMAETTGVYIAGFALPDTPSPAADAGVLAGDILMRWNEVEVSSPSDLRRLVEKTRVGTKVRIAVRRGGREMTLDVTVGQRQSLPQEI